MRIKWRELLPDLAQAERHGERNAIFAGIFCLAFSVELALQAALLSEGARVEGHRLDKLFAQLPSARQEAIIQACGIGSEAFANELGLVANAFVEWRYIYEKPGVIRINKEFLLALSQTVTAVAKNGVQAQRRGVA